MKPRRSVADDTTDRLRRAILDGQYPVGSLLPPERGLSESFGVSRLTLRSAIARLQTEGLVRPQQGAGTRVLDYRASAGVDLLGDMLGLSLSRGTLPAELLADLLELRRMLAVEVLGLAAERGSVEEHRALREHVAHQRTLVGDAEAYVEADLKMARMLVRASHNVALRLLSNSLVRVLNAAPSLAPAFLVNADGTLRAYTRLLDLVESRDGARVRVEARRLLEQLDADTLERVRALSPESPAVMEQAGEST
ncbi:MAG: FadR family transcriptional regulator [Deltaproteobacteria bacterium]|nr:FadR family transcriptional regulator [Deltaproteobacteria bacterium]